MFITKCEAFGLAIDYNLNETELNDFVELFQDSCFILAIDDYIILNIEEFFSRH